MKLRARELKVFLEPGRGCDGSDYIMIHQLFQHREAVLQYDKLTSPT